VSVDFGDSEPEDSWDPDDPVAELVDNLRRRVVALLALHAVDEQFERRLAMLHDDLAHVAQRVAD
jgi:hypothetical protein